MKKFKHFLKKAILWMKKNKVDVVIFIIAFITLIIGTFAIGFLKTTLMITIILIVLYYKPILNFIMPKKAVNTKEDIVKKVKKMEKKTKRKSKKTWKKVLKILLILAFVFFLIAMVAVGLFFRQIVKEAPEFSEERLYSKESTIIYNDKGEIFAKLGKEKREKITYDEMSEVLIDAIIATEDSRFFQHNGFDLPRFLKASFGQLLGRDAGGASTLTMQVAKNNFNGTESHGWAGIKRKFSDIYMAIFKIEKHYTKQQILEFYANIYYMGAGAYGVEQASQTYFGKSAAELNLSEAALIAGLFQSPDAYNPYENPELAGKRRSTVLYLMERHGYISNEERKAAEAIPVENLLTKNAASSSAYLAFIDTVVKEVKNDTGNDPYDVPMEIYSTMNQEQQDHINYLINGGGFNFENEVVQEGVAVVNTNTGAITAISNGRNKKNANSFNYATDIENQIGSTAKPLYDYGPAFEFNKWNTYHPLIDEEYTYSNGGNVNNFDGRFKGFMTLRTALVESRNIPAIKTFQQVSNAKIKSFVTSLGLSPELEDGIIHEAHAIGGYNGESPLTIAAAYAAFGNGGYYTSPYSYTKIVYRDTGETYEQKAQKNKVMSEETAYLINNILVDTAKYTVGRYWNVNNIQYAAKSGTTNFDDQTFRDYNLPNNAIKDLWIASTNVDYSIAVWYGYDHIDRNYVSIFGNSEHNRLFQAVAKGIYKDGSGFKRPSNVIEVEIESESYPDALLPSEFTPADKRTKELFIKGTEPTKVSDRYSKLENVSNVNAKLNGSTVTLSWDEIETPNAINSEYLTTYFQSMYKKETDWQKAYNERMAYNNSAIGGLTYRIYTKDSDGDLTYIGQTGDTTFDYKLPTNRATTFVIKSSYTIFTNNMSDGATFTFKPDGMSDVISMELNGDETVNLSIGEEYKEPSPSVIVLENLIDVSSKAVVSTTVKRNSDGKTISLKDIDTSKEETYVITYQVKYNSSNDTLTRTIKIQ